ncbi:hypothetical protein [Fructilactobacillus cliffordii]|uniref:Uncharacterized protein n=1 Tax=Fructilactobacillus cliffordii TaxID=2940299 RepID=A0A9Q8ZVA3_9LACO|nr:hypothetical protein [Fructilactobacillus cliffordii]USS89973.1 hypothetical protein M3M40_07235 [Fructilactobacillus cliffordii]
MVEIIDPHLWKETIKHAFELEKDDPEHKSKILDPNSKGTFARLIHYNMGLALLKNGFEDDKQINVKSIFEDKPRKYPENIMDFRNAADINDFQYLQNILYISINSIPNVEKINVNDVTQNLMMKAAFNLYEEEQNIVKKHHEIFNKEIYSNPRGYGLLGIEKMTLEQSLDIHQRVDTSTLSGSDKDKVCRKDVLGKNSQLLWGISEHYQRDIERKIYMRTNLEFKLKEMAKEEKMSFKNYFKTTESFQAAYSKYEADELIRNNPEELAKQVKYYYDSATPMEKDDDRGNQDAIDEAIKEAVNSYEYDQAQNYELEKGVDVDINDLPESLSNQVDKYEERLHSENDILSNNHGDKTMQNRKLNKGEESGIDYLLSKSEITKDEFYSGINFLEEQNSLSKNPVSFKDISDNLAKEEGLQYNNGNLFVSKSSFTFNDVPYTVNDTAGPLREFTNSDYAKLLKSMDWELKYVRSNKGIDKDINLSATDNLKLEERLKHSKDVVTPKINKLKDDNEPEFSKFLKNRGIWLDNESGIYMVNANDLERKESIFWIGHPEVDGADLNTEKRPMPLGNAEYNSLFKDWDKKIKNGDVEVNKEKSHFDSLGRTAERESVDYNISSKLNKTVSSSFRKAFENNSNFEKLIQDHGELFNNFDVKNVLAISAQVDYRTKNNPKLGGTTVDVDNRKGWVEKNLYPKKSDAIGDIVVNGRIEKFYTSDSFKNYGPDHKDKSKYASFKNAESKVDYGVSNSVRQKAYDNGISKSLSSEEDSLVKAATRYVVGKELHLDNQEPFKIPSGTDVKNINPTEQMKVFNQIHSHAKRAVGIAKVDIFNLKKPLAKGKNKEISKNPNNKKQPVHKR